ncbi:MAG: Lrp/AsnC family transcriptional regulator, partial [Deltaproteobacteria bacterium]|nr:Lrp/AsnC family transcriptional regulator [Deltaproteobacteria bacterium]
MPLSTEDRNALIRAIQAGVPFEARPFRAIAEDLGSTESAIIDALCELEREKILREISAVLEGTLLGYQSALATGTIADDRIEAVAEVVSA